MQTEPEPIDGLIWNSFTYDPTALPDGHAGPDWHDRCESPRHIMIPTPAAWVEMLWFPGQGFIAARCWKTCEECHAGMADSHKEG